MKKRILLLSFIALCSMCAFAQNVPSYVSSNGLVGWWPFNGNANDESGNGNSGTVNGATMTTDRFGLSNKAYSFDGIDDMISITCLVPIGSSARTVSAWFITNTNTIPTSQYPLIQNIVSWGNAFGGAVIFPMFIKGPNGNLYFESGSGNNSITSMDIVTDSSWHNAILTYDGPGNPVRYYLDGQLINITSNITLATANSFVGIGNSPFANVPFLGSLDDIGIWNRALTECEIQDLYHAQLGSQAISAGLDQSICAGDNVTLSGTGGSNYQWNNNVVDGQAFAPAQSNAYVVTAQDTLGCTGTDTVAVTVLENSTSTLTETALDSYTLNGQTYTQSGTYTQTLTAANGCDSTINLNLTLNFTGMDELGTGAKKLEKITDLNGKIMPRRKNTLMLFIYEDGTVERVVEMEE